jgi:Domain of unknown function (DUF4190)
MSDQIQFSCLTCGQHIVCDVSESGRPMLCPSCNANLTVPLLMNQDTTTEGETLTPEVATPASASSVIPPPVPTPPARTSGLAVASLVCSLSSLIICVGWLPGIICGHIAKAHMRRDPTLKGRGMATAGLIIGYATLIFGVSLVAAMVLCWSSVVRYALQHGDDDMDTNQVVTTQSQTSSESATNTNESASASSNDNNMQASGPGWTMDVKDAQIPDGTVVGQIHGQDFQVRRVVFHAGNLRFLSANGEYVLVRGVGTDIANSAVEVDPNSSGDSQKIDFGWNDNGQNQKQSFSSGYALELKFDAAQKRKIRGHIYLSFPDDSKSYIAGSFTVTLPKPKPQPANNQQ